MVSPYKNTEFSDTCCAVIKKFNFFDDNDLMKLINADKILDELRASRGFLRLTDNSHPEDIKTVLKMSKKTCKKAIGALYKEKLIEIKENGIYLVKE